MSPIAEAKFHRLPMKAQLNVIRALHCAITGHPMRWTDKAAKRWWQKWMVKGETK